MASDSEDDVFFDSLEIREDWPGRDRLLVEIEAIFSFAFSNAPLNESAFSTLREEVQACMVQWDSMMAVTKDTLEGDGLRQCCIKNLKFKDKVRCKLETLERSVMFTERASTRLEDSLLFSTIRDTNS